MSENIVLNSTISSYTHKKRNNFATQNYSRKQFIQVKFQDHKNPHIFNRKFSISFNTKKPTTLFSSQNNKTYDPEQTTSAYYTAFFLQTELPSKRNCASSLSHTNGKRRPKSRVQRSFENNKTVFDRKFQQSVHLRCSFNIMHCLSRTAPKARVAATI